MIAVLQGTKEGAWWGSPATLAPSKQRQENHVWSQPGLYNKIMLGEGDQHIGDSCSMSMEEAAALSIRRPFIDTAKIHLTFDGGKCQSHFVCWLLAKLDYSILIKKMWVNYPSHPALGPCTPQRTNTYLQTTHPLPRLPHELLNGNSDISD